MSLHDWRPRQGWSIEKSVREILKAQNRADLSTVACKQWTREFVQALIPGWQPGRAFTPQEARLVGQAFCELQGLDPVKAPRQERSAPHRPRKSR